MSKDPNHPGLSDVGVRNLLFSHILALRPQAVLEIGAHIGTGSVVMAQALKLNGFGKLYTIEPQKHYRDLATGYIESAGLEDWVEVLTGYSSDASIRQYIESKAPFEVVFVDACHNFHIVKEEIGWYWPKVAENGFMFFHDSGVEAAHFDTEQTGGVRRALNDCAQEISDFRLIAYEWPLWLNQCGAAVAWKRSSLSAPPIG